MAHTMPVLLFISNVFPWLRRVASFNVQRPWDSMVHLATQWRAMTRNYQEKIKSPSPFFFFFPREQCAQIAAKSIYRARRGCQRVDSDLFLGWASRLNNEKPYAKP
ncbi:hypothetical protein BC940DRAFT_291183 [Gongronella butleri]|nr:hypothetical protein BC940DRAFT_291183 [Gongronella butleri]